MHTRSTILTFGEDTRAGRAFSSVPSKLKEEVIARLGTLIKNVSPVFLLCESSDIGVSERLRDPHTETPSLYVYDMYPGGTGLSEGFLDRCVEILDAAYELLEGCPCTTGCPSCIGPDEGKRGEGENRKLAMLSFLRTLNGTQKDTVVV